MVYTPTKPRGPIAAMFDSPGPNVALPGLMGQKLPHDPRSEHNRGPAYPFGIRYSAGSRKGEEGGFYPAPDVSAYKPRPPSYTMSSRRPIKATDNLPSPFDYDVVNCDKRCVLSSHSKKPAFTFGLLTKSRSVDYIPGPFYDIRSAYKAAATSPPAYSIVGRKDKKDLEKLPGPGEYMLPDMGKYMSRTPAYALSSRTTIPSDTSAKPGPFTYHLSDIYVSQKKPPKYSFGIRHSPYSSTLFTKDDV